MKGEKLQDAIGMVDDELIKDADSANVKKKAVWWKYGAAAAAMLVLAVSVGIVFLRDGNNEYKGEKNTTLFVDNETVNTTEGGLSTYNQENVTNGGSEEETTFGYVEQPTTGVVDFPGVDTNPVDLHTFAISECAYPKMSPYPDEGKSTYIDDYDNWSGDKWALKEAYKSLNINQDKFLASSIREMLGNSDGENKVYSPLNVYMALGMLAEITDGNSRQQILDALGVDNIENLREEANAIWKANYCDDGAVSTILASSLWLSEDVNYKEDTLKNLSSTYFASAYRGQMGSDEYNNALQTWLNENTGNLLKDQIDDIEMSPDTVMALASTIYYRARWSDVFYGSVVKQFHGSNEQTYCEFMEQRDLRSYYWGEKFSTVAQYLEGSGAMWFILPDEGVSVDELLEDEEVMKFMLSTEKWKWENQKNITVNLSIPKFDVTSQIDLKEGLMKLGVTDVFDSGVSDFTPMTDDYKDIELTSASHGARVSIDEEGCEAAAYTILMTDADSMPPDEEIDFVVDRPFIFMITSEVGMPLFVGVVNNVN